MNPINILTKSEGPMLFKGSSWPLQNFVWGIKRSQWLDGTDSKPLQNPFFVKFLQVCGNIFTIAISDDKEKEMLDML